MKKYISIFSLVIAYILCFLISSLETLGMNTSGNILLYSFILKCVFYGLIGIFVPIAAENIKTYKHELRIRIGCFAAVVFPIVLWMILVRREVLTISLEYFILIYFICLGTIIYSLIVKK